MNEYSSMQKKELLTKKLISAVTGDRSKSLDDTLTALRFDLGQVFSSYVSLISAPEITAGANADGTYSFNVLVTADRVLDCGRFIE